MQAPQTIRQMNKYNNTRGHRLSAPVVDGLQAVNAKSRERKINDSQRGNRMTDWIGTLDSTSPRWVVWIQDQELVPATKAAEIASN